MFYSKGGFKNCLRKTCNPLKLAMKFISIFVFKAFTCSFYNKMFNTSMDFDQIYRVFKSINSIMCIMALEGSVPLLPINTPLHGKISHVARIIFWGRSKHNICYELTFSNVCLILFENETKIFECVGGPDPMDSP